MRNFGSEARKAARKPSAPIVATLAKHEGQTLALVTVEQRKGRTLQQRIASSGDANCAAARTNAEAVRAALAIVESLRG